MSQIRNPAAENDRAPIACLPEHKNKTLSRMYTILVAILPALNVYNSIIPQIELGTFLLLLLTVPMICFYPRFSLGKAEWRWLIFLFVSLLCTAASIVLLNVSGEMISTIIYRYLKIFIAVIIVILIGKNYFDIHLALKANLIACYFSIALIAAQTILGKSLIGFVSVDGMAILASYTKEGLLTQSTFIRPSGFFLEPAHFAAFAMISFIYLLTVKDIKHRWLQLFIVCGGIILSTSGTGIVLLPVITILNFLLNSRQHTDHLKNQKLVLIIIIFLMTVFVIIFVNTEFGLKTIGRFIKADGTLNAGVTGRLQSGASELFRQLDTLYKWIGCGFGNRPDSVYFTSFYAVLYGNGIIGLGLVLFAIFGYYQRRSGVFQKLVTITFVFLFFGSGIFNFASIGMYFAFAGASSNRLR